MRAVLPKSMISVVILVFFAGISTASAAIYSNLIVFGDSLSDAASLSTEARFAKEKDVGNNYWANAEGKKGAPISSEDSTTKLHPLWPNYLMNNAALIDANPNQTHYIYPSRQAHLLGFSPTRYSTNYAWASAETGDEYLNDFDLNKKTYPPFIFPSYSTASCQSFGSGKIDNQHSCVPGVLVQVKEYLQDTHGHPNPRSLIIIWAGGNDIFNNAAKIADNQPGKSKSTSQIFLLLKMLNAAYPLSQHLSVAPLSNPVNNIQKAVILLIQAGVPAKNIYVMNLPNLAHTPAAQKIADGEKSILYLWEAISKIFNTALEVTLVLDIRHPEFNLPRHNVIFVNQILSDILENQKKYGFSMGYQSCVSNKARADCPGYIFFNNKHPTTKVNQLIAQRLSEILLRNSQTVD